MNKTLSNTWLQPGAIGKATSSRFNLNGFTAAKTVETVLALPFGSTGLTPGVNENAA